ncbi:MAG: ribosome maturation factor RimP [Oscillospiraceae bacterium]
MGGSHGKNAKGNTVAVVTEPSPAVLSRGFRFGTYALKKKEQTGTRIFIDKEPHVEMDDCVALHHKVSDLLDLADPISQSYYLEISSPGLGRELVKPAHFERFLGETVRVKTIRPIDGVREFRGALEGFANQTVTLAPEGGGETKAFPMSEVSSVKLCDDDNLFDV